MGIQKDAGELLIYFYKNYVEEDKMTQTKDIVDETKWSSGRINRAIDYLRDMDLLNISLSMGNYQGVYNFRIMRLYPRGIALVENEKEFKRNFNFGVNLGLIQFSWGASDR